MPRCETTDLDTAMCAHCLGHKGVEDEVRAERVQLLRTPGWVRARFAGRCQHCGEPYTPGTPIRALDPYGWIAECCAGAGV